MKLQVLVTSMYQTDDSLYDKMNINSDCLIANQTDCYRLDITKRGDNRIKLVSTSTRGVGKNRNIALMEADGDILLFADDDIRYNDDYAEKVIDAFENNKQADAIIFGMDLTKDGKVFCEIRNRDCRARLFNSLRYGTYVLAVRRQSVLKHNVFFHQMFGGGCQYSCGEDSIYIRDCFKAKMKIYKSSYVLGNCSKDESTWFKGYNDKYFYDKGALFKALFPNSFMLFRLMYAIRIGRNTGVKLNHVIRLFFKGYNEFLKIESN